MKIKICFMVAALLVLYVILHLIDIEKGNRERVDRGIAEIEQLLRENQAEKLTLEQEKRKLETALLSIPKTILEGFEDSERQFVDFMDYIKVSGINKMQGNIAISQIQTFKNLPVPLQESLFEFQFTMEKTQQLEKFLDYLLIKGKYPLNVQQLEIKRIPKQFPHVYLKVALLLPAKIDLPQLTKTDKEAS